MHHPYVGNCSCGRPRIHKQAKAQKAYAPCASVPGQPEIPPSYVWPVQSSQSVDFKTLRVHSHRDSHSGRLSRNEVIPYFLAGASRGRSRGRRSREIKTMAQYAPLIRLVKRKDISWYCGTHRTSISPPWLTEKPPSGCLSFPSQLHL